MTAPLYVTALLKRVDFIVCKDANSSAAQPENKKPLKCSIFTNWRNTSNKVKENYTTI